MQALREGLKEAGAYIYGNRGEDGNYYVGIYDNGPNGNGPAFEQVNDVAGEIGAVIRDTQVVTLEFVDRGNVTDDDRNTRYIGRASRAGNQSGINLSFQRATHNKNVGLE